MRASYWSNSKFANWIRGTDKLFSGTGDEWKEWKETAKSKHPVRYWIVEKGFDSLQNLVNWVPDKLYSLKYYTINRWIDQSHALVAHPKHIKPGQWLDLDRRILYCLFDELVDFVEIEKAYSNFRWDSDKQKNMKWWQVGKWRTRTWRSAEAGIDYLKWEMSLIMDENYTNDKEKLGQPTPQASSAKEIYDLYIWWTETYVNRPDVFDVSGWSAYCEDKRVRGIGFMETDPLEDEAETKKILDKNRELEEAYEQEDEDMLIRLIKLRGSLWT